MPQGDLFPSTIMRCFCTRDSKNPLTALFLANQCLALSHCVIDLLTFLHPLTHFTTYPAITTGPGLNTINSFCCVGKARKRVSVTPQGAQFLSCMKNLVLKPHYTSLSHSTSGEVAWAPDCSLNSFARNSSGKGLPQPSDAL